MASDAPRPLAGPEPCGSHGVEGGAAPLATALEVVAVVGAVIAAGFLAVTPFYDVVGTSHVGGNATGGTGGGAPVRGTATFLAANGAWGVAVLVGFVLVAAAPVGAAAAFPRKRRAVTSAAGALLAALCAASVMTVGAFFLPSALALLAAAAMESSGGRRRAVDRG